MTVSRERSPESVRAAVAKVLSAGRFFVGDRRLRIEHGEREQLPWEVFLGHLLDAAHARHNSPFETWNVFLDEGSEPAAGAVLGILWYHADARMHVVRRILTHGFTTYEDSPGVILSRPAEKWQAELVGTIDVEQLGRKSLEEELGRLLYLAVVGTSRLAITSLESPLPDFSLGRLSYLPSLAGSAEPMRDACAFLREAFLGSDELEEQARALETALRSVDRQELARVAATLEEGRIRHAKQSDWTWQLFRAVFNGAALSPYTQFTESLVGVLELLATEERLGRAAVVDMIGYMLRHLCRHLTAFDLTTFHNSGANYPDALFLDALLAAYLRLAREEVELFRPLAGDAPHVALQKRRRRRALRQACLARRQYEGHRVPDVPTSLGEYARVLPAPFARVPEEQILQVSTRKRRLFEDRSLDDLLGQIGRELLDESLVDLKHFAELRELGLALYLDRPLGVLKQPGEVDRTPLLSYEAVSRAVARRRVAQMKASAWLTAARAERLSQLVKQMPLSGVSIDEIRPVERPGVVTLADAAKTASDFIAKRTTRGSLAALLSYYDLRELAARESESAAWLVEGEALFVQHGPPLASLARPTLRAYDRLGELRLELGFDVLPDGSVRYVERAGVELPERLSVLRVGRAIDSGAADEIAASEGTVWLSAGTKRP
jgi:hypothetical protein